MKIKIEALRDDQVEEISEKTEKLLWEQGIVVNDTDVCTYFSDRGAKVTGSTIFLPKEMVRNAIESAPERHTLHARNPERTVTFGKGFDMVINGNSGMSYIQGADGIRRPARVKDQIDMIKLSHTSKVMNVSNAGIVYPTADIDPADAKYIQMINALTYSDKPFIAQGFDKSCATTAISLARIATGYNDRPVCMCIVNSLSPMTWDSKMLGVIRVYAEENQPLNISSSSMIGATAPLNLMSALITACAEALFGITYSQLIRPGSPVIFGCFPGIMDMRAMSMSYGSPEFAIMCAAASQMSAHYRIPFRGGGALTSAKVTDAQSSIESALNMMVSMNCEVHYMHQSIGSLDSILSCSAEKFIMDEEIVARVRHMQKGMGEIEQDVFDVIRDGCQERSFLALESTAMNFRNVLFSPIFVNDCTYEEWIENGKSGNEMAREVAERRIAEYVEPDIGADIKRQMREFALGLGANI
ncbi:MAG: trimethylamine methyltransferase family protein [Oscillospiraceae bacterium]|nr:trimethylamine methyltransferase family protein [Oscillospiraceae bacterium]